MRSDEIRDAGALTGTALGELAQLARGVHTALADRLFGLAGVGAGRAAAGARRPGARGSA